MILFFRLWLLGLILGLAWAALSFLLTRDRRYLRFGGRIFFFSMLFAVVLLALRFLQRAVLF